MNQSRGIHKSDDRCCSNSLKATIRFDCLVVSTAEYPFDLDLLLLLLSCTTGSASPATHSSQPVNNDSLLAVPSRRCFAWISFRVNQANSKTTELHLGAITRQRSLRARNSTSVIKTQETFSFLRIPVIRTVNLFASIACLTAPSSLSKLD